MAEHKTEAEKRAKVRDMVNQIGNAFMVTHNAAGGLHGRPMATAKLSDNWDKLYFPTARDSGKVEELEKDASVYLGYANSSGSDWVSITGTARTTDDKAVIKQVWSPAWKNWFDGPDDPKLVLVEVTPDSAEYWDSGSKIFILASMAIAAVTGKKMPDGENEKVGM